MRLMGTSPNLLRVQVELKSKEQAKSECCISLSRYNIRFHALGHESPASHAFGH